MIEQHAVFVGEGFMRRFSQFVLSVWLLVGSPAFAQQQDFSKIDVKGSKVNGNVYMLQADPGSGNIGASVGPDGILIVDDQFAPLADEDWESGGDVEGFVKNVETVLAQIPADARVIPGHGPLSTYDDLKTYHRMLRETTESVRQRMAAGKSLDAIKAEGLSDEWKPFGAGFIKTEMWIEAIHKGLSQKKDR